MITHGKPEARGWGGSMRVAADVALTEYFTDIYFFSVCDLTQLKLLSSQVRDKTSTSNTS